MDTVKYKFCKKCNQKKEINKFAKSFAKKQQKYYYHSSCNSCESRIFRKSASGKESIKKTKKRIVENYKNNRIELKKRIMKEIGQEKCLYCNFDNPIALCFHHRNPEEKKFKISWGFSHYYSFKKILPEAKKCDVLCFNCHTKKHKIESKKTVFNLKIKELLMYIIGQNECKKCGYKNSECLSFHHINRKEKVFKLSDLRLSEYNTQDIINEVKKCEILCMNCHCIHHYNEYIDISKYTI